MRPLISDLTRATLLCDPWVELASGLELPVRLSRSSAGPGAGGKGSSGALYLAFGGRGRHTRVNVTTNANFRLEPDGGRGYRLTHRGQPFLNGVELVEPLLHAPDMAFINLYPGCRYDCAFCPTPRLKQKGRPRSPAQVAAMVQAAATDRLRSVALTSGVRGSPSATAADLAEAVRAVRDAVPGVPVGVEPYLTDPGDLLRLKEAGAEEVKLNIQAATPTIFRAVCPALDWEQVWANLAAAVEVFGRGRVQSNLLVGLGETHEEAAAALDRLCGLGVLPTVRPVRLDETTRPAMAASLGREAPRLTPEYLLELLGVQAQALERHGLTDRAGRAATMCPSCGGCELSASLDL